MSCEHDSCNAGQITTGNNLLRCEFPEFMVPGDRVCVLVRVLGFSRFLASFVSFVFFFVVSFVSFVSFITFGSSGLSCALGFEIRCVVVVAAFLFCRLVRVSRWLRQLCEIVRSAQRVRCVSCHNMARYHPRFDRTRSAVRIAPLRNIRSSYELMRFLVFCC
jgi:hypothetical protein